MAPFIAILVRKVNDDDDDDDDDDDVSLDGMGSSPQLSDKPVWIKCVFLPHYGLALEFCLRFILSMFMSI